MVVRRRKKRVNKMLGQRTRGNGDTKRRRGAGSRGGRGLAGSHKHKYSKYAGKFGQEKKKVLSRKIVREINIDLLIQKMPKLEAAGKISKEANTIIIDGSKIGFDKLLSKGEITQKIIVRNMKASKKAIEKIKKAGGDVELKESAGEEFEEKAEEKTEKETAKEEKETAEEEKETAKEIETPKETVEKIEEKKEVKKEEKEKK